MSVKAKVLFLGGGSLAKEVLLAMPAALKQAVAANPTGDIQCSLTIASRSLENTEWLALLGESRARSVRSSMTVRAKRLVWSESALADLIVETDPDLIFHTASLQSAWNLNETDSPWARLVRKAGYGLTVALQAALLFTLNRAFSALGYQVPVINACYPDLVNACLTQIGLPIAAGIGNVALIADAMQHHLKPRHASRLRVVAGHYHVSQLMLSQSERTHAPRCWLGQHPVSRAVFLRLPRLRSNPSINALNAGPAAMTIASLLLRRGRVYGHLPGVNGMIGGYPVKISDGIIAVDCPLGITKSYMIQQNEKASIEDGATIRAGRIVFSDRARMALKQYTADLANGFRVEDLEPACQAFQHLKTRLGGDC